CDAQCGGGCLSRRPRYCDEPASRPGEGASADFTAAPTQSAERGISRLPKRAAAPSRPQRSRIRTGRINMKLTRRHYLLASGALAATGLIGARPAQALETVRQGYQTNMWGMPTYYLMHSGLLEKQGLKFEEFAVPSGNLTMQQMVARQVDLGT